MAGAEHLPLHKTHRLDLNITDPAALRITILARGHLDLLRCLLAMTDRLCDSLILLSGVVSYRLCLLFLLFQLIYICFQLLFIICCLFISVTVPVLFDILEHLLKSILLTYKLFLYFLD